MRPALIALLLVVLGLLAWRAITRERRDYARFKRLRSTTARQRVYARWLTETVLVFGGLTGAVLLAAWEYAPAVLQHAQEWAPVAAIRDSMAGWTGIAIGAGLAVAGLAAAVVPILLVRGKLDEVPAVGDIRALLPRTRGELRYGAGLAVSAGVLEELLFRLAMPALVFGIVGDGVAAFVACAVLFGFLHLYQRVAGVAFAILAGLLFAALYVLTGSILVPIAVHLVLDLRSLVLIPVVLGDAWRRS